MKTDLLRRLSRHGSDQSQEQLSGPLHPEWMPSRCLGEARPAGGILPAIVVHGSPCYPVMPEAVPLQKVRPALPPTTDPSLSAPNPSNPWTSEQVGNGTCLNMTSTIVEFRLRDYGPANGHLTQVNLVCFLPDFSVWSTYSLCGCHCKIFQKAEWKRNSPWLKWLIRVLTSSFQHQAKYPSVSALVQLGSKASELWSNDTLE